MQNFHLLTPHRPHPAPPALTPSPTRLGAVFFSERGGGRTRVGLCPGVSECACARVFVCVCVCVCVCVRACIGLGSGSPVSVCAWWVWACI